VLARHEVMTATWTDADEEEENAEAEACASAWCGGGSWMCCGCS